MTSTRYRRTLTLYEDFHELMADEVRMGAYAEAISRAIEPGDVVVDLGAGLGILGFMALRAGAGRVHLIEKGDALELARQVAEENGLADRCVFHQANSKEVELDERVDWIVSETLGSFAVDENTLEFTIDARERFLKEDGGLLPYRLGLFLAPVEAEAEYARILSWKDVQGIDYGAAMRQILGRMSLAEFTPERLLAPAALYDELDLYEVESPRLERKLEFGLERTGTLHGLAGWFEADLYEELTIRTAPDAPLTHWKQAFFPFREPVEVSPGDVLQVILRVGPKEELSDDTAVSYEYFCGTPAPPL